MLFIVSKCKALHADRNNPKVTFEMNDVTLRTIEDEKDEGWFFISLLNVTGILLKL